MAIYKISHRAKNDLVDIYIRGFKEWGENKSNSFQIQLIESFQLLANTPDAGHSVFIHPELQRFEKGPYVIFYRKFSYGVRIARILYKNRAMEKHL